MINKLKKIAQLAKDFLYPPQCHICHSPLTEHDRYICPMCISDLPLTFYHRHPDHKMEKKLKGKFPYERITGHYFYTPDTPIAQLIHEFKYYSFRGLAHHFGTLVASDIHITGFFSDIDYLIPMPIHFTKRLKRGYNQTEEIALGISERTSIPISTALRARKPHKTQTHLTPQQRLKNTQNIFTLNHGHNLENKHILLIDDVCTTGSTLTSAALAILHLSPTTRISILTIATTS